MFLDTGRRLAPGFPALEVAPGDCGPVARPATSSALQQICNFWSNSQTVTLSSAQLCRSTSPVDSWPPYCTQTWREKELASGQHLAVLTPCALGSGTQELPETSFILWLIFSSWDAPGVPASYLNIQTSQSGSVLTETNLYKFFRWREQGINFWDFLF